MKGSWKEKRTEINKKINQRKETEKKKKIHMLMEI